MRNYMVAGTNLPVGGAVPTQLRLGGSVLGVAGCPENEFKVTAVKTLKYMTSTIQTIPMEFGM